MTPSTVAVCKAVQNVLCFIAYNAVYCGKQCGDHDQLNQVWTNYNSLVDDFFSKRGKWTYLNNYDIKDAMISAGIQESDFTIDRDHLFLQTAKKMLVADNVIRKPLHKFLKKCSYHRLAAPSRFITTTICPVSGKNSKRSKNKQFNGTL